MWIPKVKTLFSTIHALLLLAVSFATNAQDTISPNGYSGLGLTPNAGVIRSGQGVVNFDTSLPGAPNNLGYNYQVGFGLFDNLEVVARLTTNDLKCNMFRRGVCPPNMIRDFSGSIKWTVPSDWLSSHGAKIAFGVNDAAGAAVFFRSHYAVASKTFGPVDLSLGTARAMGRSAILDGSFGSVTWNLSSWAKFSAERIGSDNWAHAGFSVPIASTGASAWLTSSHQLNDNALTQKSWTGMGISVPLDRVQHTPRVNTIAVTQSRRLKSTNAVDLPTALASNGFHGAKIGKTLAGTVVVEVDSNAYQWDIMDAAGVALGVVAGAFADQTQAIDLIVSTRGVQQLIVKSDSACIKQWYQAEALCENMQIQSLSNQSYDMGAVTWSEKPGWQFRPEAVLIPIVVSAIGTEIGAFDMDLGLNFNTVLPLWKGAYVEHAQIYPLNYNTDNFQRGKAFYPARITEYTARRLVHQLVSLPWVNTQARLSAGMAYRNWEGAQIETTTQSNNGRHKFGLNYGRFSNDALTTNNEKTYQLLNYRYVPSHQKTSSEITTGKFWGGDTGFLLSQKFWHGDTAITLYIRRSRMSEADKLVSFAGLQISLPLTPRKNTGFSHFSVRGSNQWSYTVETKVFDEDNIITGGFGEVPTIGASIAQSFNRDRNSSAYYQSQQARLKDAFVKLAGD